MFGAGAVLAIFGVIFVAIGKSLDGSGGDLFALAGLLPMIGGTALVVVGAAFMLMGL